MSMFDFAKSTISSVLSNTTSGLPFASATSGLIFSIGQKYPGHGGIEYSSGAASLWTLHHGTKKDDSSPVTVFIFEKSKHEPYLLSLARNALKRAKTIRHPDVLRFIDGTETDTQIIIGTEFCEPLSVILERDKQKIAASTTNLSANHADSLKTLGLFKIATTLKFLTKDYGMIHGHVGIHSVLCTKAGEYKLAGFELLSSLKEEGAIFTTQGSSFYAKQRISKYLPPEFAKNWPSMNNIPTHSVDAWAYGCLIHELFVGTFSSHDELLLSLQQAGNTSGSGSRGSLNITKASKTNGVPSGLVPFYKAFLNTDPARRLDFGVFLDKAKIKGRFFDTEFISTSLFFENIALKEQGEKDDFIRHIHDKIDQFPINFSKYKILPELVKALEYGGAGTKAITPILKISADLTQEEFEAQVNPVLLRLFSSQDRAIRVALCDHIHLYIQHFSPRIVSDKIFPNLVTGFSDTSAVVRESSLKSILHIAPKLNEKLLNNDLLRILAKLQADEEPGIRTNTTICLGKLASYVNEDVKKVLITAFLRSLKDSFPPARNAGLLAIGATISFIEPQALAQRVLPAVSPLLLDPEKIVRVQAEKNVDLFLKKIQQHASTMPETAIPPPTDKIGSDKSNAGGGTSIVSSAAADTFGWAMSAVSSKLSTLAVGNNGNVTANTTGTSNGLGASDSSTGAKSAGGIPPLAPIRPSEQKNGFAGNEAINGHSGGMKLTSSSSLNFSNPSNNATTGGLKLTKTSSTSWNTAASGWDMDDWDDSPTKTESKSSFPSSTTPVGFGNTAFGTSASSSTTSSSFAQKSITTPVSTTSATAFGAKKTTTPTLPAVNTKPSAATSGWDFDAEWDSPTKLKADSAPFSSTKPASIAASTSAKNSSQSVKPISAPISDKFAVSSLSATAAPSTANNDWGDWNDGGGWDT